MQFCPGGPEHGGRQTEKKSRPLARPSEDQTAVKIHQTTLKNKQSPLQYGGIVHITAIRKRNQLHAPERHLVTAGSGGIHRHQNQNTVLPHWERRDLNNSIRRGQKQPPIHHHIRGGTVQGNTPSAWEKEKRATTQKAAGKTAKAATN